MELKKLAGATALAFLLTAGAAAAQTTGTGSTTATSTTGSGAGSTVGAPNTGAGGDMAVNAILLTTTGAIALGGAALLARRRMI